LLFVFLFGFVWLLVALVFRIVRDRPVNVDLATIAT